MKKSVSLVNSMTNLIKNVKIEIEHLVKEICNTVRPLINFENDPKTMSNETGAIFCSSASLRKGLNF